MATHTGIQRSSPLRLWIGAVLALFSGLTMLVASRYGGWTGAGGIAVFVVLALAGLVGVALVVVSLRRAAEWASTPETGRLLEWLMDRPGDLRMAEACRSAEDLRRSIGAGLDDDEAARLFGAEQAASWTDRVRWDELYDALPRAGRQVPR